MSVRLGGTWFICATCAWRRGSQCYSPSGGISISTAGGNVTYCSGHDSACPTCSGRNTITEPSTGDGEPYACPDCGGSGKAVDCIERGTLSERQTEARYGRLVERVYAGARRGGYIDEDGQKALRELYDAAKRSAAVLEGD